jgi:hypothetical protein
VMDASDLHVCHRYPITLLPPRTPSVVRASE